VSSRSGCSGNTPAPRAGSRTLTYAAARGHALIDRALYVPKSWASDDERRERAGMPAKIEFATKPALATAMIRRAVAAGTPAAWVAGDEV